MDHEVAIVQDGNRACAHYWMLNGKNSGVCNKCGAKKHFPLSWTPRSRPIAKKE